jgi:transcriptional regulator with XRE-family HTH domain
MANTPPREPLIELGKLIRHRRHVIGKNQADVATAIGISRVRIQQLETDARYVPPPKLLAPLAAALELTQGQLLRAAGYDLAEPGE